MMQAHCLNQRWAFESDVGAVIPDLLWPPIFLVNGLTAYVDVCMYVSLSCLKNFLSQFSVCLLHQKRVMFSYFLIAWWSVWAGFNYLGGTGIVPGF